jgi:hypothetical protein
LRDDLGLKFNLNHEELNKLNDPIHTYTRARMMAAAHPDMHPGKWSLYLNGCITFSILRTVQGTFYPLKYTTLIANSGPKNFRPSRVN